MVPQYIDSVKPVVIYAEHAANAANGGIRHAWTQGTPLDQTICGRRSDVLLYLGPYGTRSDIVITCLYCAVGYSQ